jgi:hypothetical protein
MNSRVQGPAGRRTVWPTCTTPALALPPDMGISPPSTKARLSQLRRPADNIAQPTSR